MQLTDGMQSGRGNPENMFDRFNGDHLSFILHISLVYYSLYSILTIHLLRICNLGTFRGFWKIIFPKPDSYMVTLVFIFTFFLIFVLVFILFVFFEETSHISISVIQRVDADGDFGNYNFH